MSLRTALVLLLSMVCGTSAAVGVHYLQGKGPRPAVSPPTVPLVVAATDVPRGTVLKPELVRLQDWPEALVPAGALTDCRQANDRAATAALVAGEPILESKISTSGQGAAGLVRPGMRAYTILTPSAATGVGGFVLPGNRVDVLLTVAKHGSDAEAGGTWTLLQNVEVLAADQRLDQAEQKKGEQQLKSVTLLVTPDMAAKLTLAQSMGTLHLTLRNDADTAIARTTPVTMRDLRFLQEAMWSGPAQQLLTSVGKTAWQFLQEAAQPPAEAGAGEDQDATTVAVQAVPANSSAGIVCLRGTSSSTVHLVRRRPAAPPLEE